MSNSLNSSNDNFIFNLPSGFVPKSIDDRYKIILDNLHLPYASVLDYLNSTIKEINIPQMSFPTVKQSKMYGKERLFRGSSSPYDLYGRDFSLIVKNVDHNITYFIFMDCLFFHYSNLEKPFIENFIITILDNNRRELYKIHLKEVIERSFSDLRLANQQVDQDEKDMTISFVCNFIDIEFIPKYGDDLDDGTLIENYYDDINKNDI